MDIYFEECPNCGEMLFEDDMYQGFCPGCGFSFETEEAA